MRCLQNAVAVTWPVSLDEIRQIEGMTASLTAKYTPWLVEAPHLKMLHTLRRTQRRLAEMSTVKDVLTAFPILQMDLEILDSNHNDASITSANRA
jgi:hypothetical protein